MDSDKGVICVVWESLERKFGQRQICSITRGLKSVLAVVAKWFQLISLSSADQEKGILKLAMEFIS